MIEVWFLPSLLASRDTFCFDPNMCRNHVTAIPAANFLQQKHFENRETHDAFYDEVVRFLRVGHEEVAVKCDAAMIALNL